MELKSCNSHFIRTIRGQKVIRVFNSRPALVTKTLQDIYKSEDAKRIRRIHSRSVKTEVPCFPTLRKYLPHDSDDDATLKQLRDRSLMKKRKYIHGHKNYVNASKDEKTLNDHSDLDELIINLKAKKPKDKKKRITRNVASSSSTSLPVKSEGIDVSENSQGFGGVATVVSVKIEFQEDSELGEHIKTTLVDDSLLDVNEDQSFDDASNKDHTVDQHDTEQLIECTTNEISYSHLEDTELGEHIKTTLVDDSLLDVNEEQSFDDASNKDHTVDDQQYTEQQIGCTTNEISYSHLEDTEQQEDSELGEHIKTTLVDHSLLDVNEEQSFDDASNKDHTFDQHDTEQLIGCTTNEISNSHLEDTDPISMLVLWRGMDDNIETEELDSDEYKSPHFMLVPWYGVNVDLETQEFDFDEYQNPLPLAIEYVNETFDDQDPFITSHMSEENISSGEQFPDISMGLPHEQDDALSSHDQDYVSSQNSTLSLTSGETLVSLEDTTADKEPPSFCTLDGIKSNSLDNGGTHMEDSASPIIVVETQSGIKKQHFDNAESLSSPEPYPRPEKLLLKRKVIPPSSRERLRLVMNAEEHCGDVDQYISLKCEEKLFAKQTGKKVSFFRSDNSSAKATINGARGHFNHANNLRHTTKNSQNGKGNYEGVRPRTLPKLTTACNSIEGCSENAIEFSQRQMHDMENIAVKLMDELNSMKEVVEQKLLYAAYRNVPSKNDADEVKSAIIKATKAEEAARKWLTVMSRDCNRFCKIMKMTPKSGIKSEDTARNGTKKITFADEVGGELCHVKIFKYGESSPMADEVKQGLNSI